MIVVFNLIISFLLLGLLAYTFHKVRRIHLLLYKVRDEMANIQTSTFARLRKVSDDQFRQLEALWALSWDLGLKMGLPSTRGWAASPDFLRELILYTLENQPKTVVECGSGVSTIVLARCMQMTGKGHVYSLEHGQEHAEKTMRHLERYGLRDWATVIYAPLRSHDLRGEPWMWYSTENLPDGGFDMLVIDGPPGNMCKRARYPAGPFLFHRLNPGGVGFVDDAARADEVEILQEWANEFPDLRQERLDCEKGCVALYKPAVPSTAGIENAVVSEDKVAS